MQCLHDDGCSMVCWAHHGGYIETSSMEGAVGLAAGQEDEGWRPQAIACSVQSRKAISGAAEGMLEA